MSLLQMVQNLRLAKIEYKLADADAYIEVAPTEVGEYDVGVTIFYNAPWNNTPVIYDSVVKAFSISDPSTTN